ncbi:ADP-ribose pyrophosphatase YjhB, NUDIX family [Cryptosporangium aurantiacum]|uniref:ADP-ribose pyrophosphatase YjhB, NUDIX family n=1 Tax=Cryptosporangium aurantiacum TaxID=134849 RepID=A0A1M7MCF5_9ACTN|nr:ADP-ribose pyrophosphatase YjhB, NUDIX family [Cryptosporangium aurantiacum]
MVPAAYVLLRRGDDDRVLMQLRQNTGFLDGHWAIGAAGHVEAGESVLDAACREAAEELGVQVRPDDLVPLCVMHRTRNTRAAVDERVDFFFECRRWDGEPDRREPDRAAELRWVALDALPDPVVPHERHVLERWRDGTLTPVVPYGFG